MSRIEEAISVIIQELNLKTENDAVFALRVSEKMRESFAGYHVDFNVIFGNKLPNERRVSQPIEFHSIPFISYCKHHMTPIIGHVTVSYIPKNFIVGLSRIVECVNAFAGRLQLQEEMTVEIADCLARYLEAKFVRVEVVAKHYCMQKSPNDTLPDVKTSYEISA